MEHEQLTDIEEGYTPNSEGPMVLQEGALSRESVSVQAESANSSRNNVSSIADHPPESNRMEGPDAAPPRSITQSAITGNQTVHFEYPFKEDDIMREREGWKAHRDACLASLEQARRETERHSSLELPNAIIRNYALSAQDQHAYRQLRLDDLRKPENTNLNATIYAQVDELGRYWENIQPRWRAFLEVASQLPVSSWQMEASKDILGEYWWCSEVYEFVDESLNVLDELVRTARVVQAELGESPPASPTAVLESTSSTTRGPQMRHTSETSNTRTREHFLQQVRSHRTPLRTRPTLAQGTFIQATGAYSVPLSMSNVDSYKTNAAMLAAVSFFGASVAWNQVFSGSRGDLVLQAWSSCTFISGSVAAAAIGIILDSDTIDLDRDMGARRAVRSFLVVSAVFILAGIILLCVTMSGVEPSYAAGDSTPAVLSPARSYSMVASGWVTIGMVIVEIILAVCVRGLYGHSRYKW